MVEQSSSSSSSPSPGGVNKRNRDSEDEAYLDNFHSHKRYLSEIMASSLNGLTVGESMSDNLIESPARSESTISYLRDDIFMQYSPMSEDSEDARYSETPLNISMAPSDNIPTSPSSSPHRHQKPFNGTTSTTYPSLSCNLTASQPRQRGSDSEGRFPSSPSDICHSADLRRAALLRSVQMRVHPAAPPSYDIPFGVEQESIQDMEGEEPPCSCKKSLVADCGCQNQHLFGKVKATGSEHSLATPNRMLDINEEELCDGTFERNDQFLSRRSIMLRGNTESCTDSGEKL